MPRAHHDACRNGAHGEALHIAMAERPYGDDGIVRAVRKPFESCLSRGKLVRHLDTETCPRERGRVLAHHLVAGKGRRVQRKPKSIGQAAALAVRPGERLQAVEPGDNIKRLLAELLAERRGTHAAALAHEQALAQLALEVGDGLRHRLHGYVQVFRRRGQTAVLDDRGQVCDLLYVQRRTLSYRERA